MPLRRRDSARASGLRSQQRTPKSRRSEEAHSDIASSSYSTPSPSYPHTNGSAATPDHARRAKLGDLFSYRNASRSVKAAQLCIELLDSSDEEAAPYITALSHQRKDEPDLDDVVTPELPPADDFAPPLPSSPSDTFATPEPPPTDVIVRAEVDIASEKRLDLDDDREPSPPIESPPDPLANQRPLFDPKELEMQPLYDELKVLLETEQISDADDDDEDYEQRRLRKLRANDALLAQLGLAGANSFSVPAEEAYAGSDHAQDQDDGQSPVPQRETPARGRGRPPKRGGSNSAHPSDPALETRIPKRKKYPPKVKFADDGTTKSAPPKGQIFTVAYVEISSLRNRARNDYVFIRDVPDIRPEDLVSWSEDEDEQEDDADAEDEVVAGSVDQKEPRKGKRARQPDVLPDGTILSSCHQCRRKTSNLKMHCSRVGCTLMFCQRCITIRYDDVVFNPSAQNFVCPKCLGFCNCSICLRRSGLGDLVHQTRDRLAFSRGRQKHATTHGPDGEEAYAGDTGAERAAFANGAEPKLKKRRSYSETVRNKPSDRDLLAHGPTKRRGRPPKKREAGLAFVPVRIELDLSDEVAEGEVFSQLEEYVLGRLHVARRILKLMAAKQAAIEKAAHTDITAPNPKLIVKLRARPRASAAARTFMVAESAEDEKLAGSSQGTSAHPVQKSTKTPNYHDAERDVWVRSAADYSASESENGSTNEDEEDMLDVAETMFEEGRTQSFAASLLQRQDPSSAATSRGSSPLTSLDELDDTSDVSSQFDVAANDVSREADDSGEEPDTSTQASAEVPFPSSSLGMPQHMQQLALAVLDDHDESEKLMQADVVRLEEALAFPSTSDPQVGQLGGSLHAQSSVATPGSLRGVACPDLDDT
ncbi:zf-4CXXC_R1 domain-containing protein [Pseudozyma hubeiensis]|nr:zf-4CXXC_R1 domain-containing protein [Pseudozyma hubeiensis]